jgi:hypothetical protein
MYSWRAATAAAAVSASLLVLPTAAEAQSVVVLDRAGDTGQPGLDVTSARFGNRDHAIVTTLTFTVDRPGTVIVAIGTRDRRIAAVIGSRHHRQGQDRVSLFNPRGAARRCAGLSSEWKRPSATLQIRLPARCVSRGNYGAIRAWVLAEPLHSGGDVDYAPEDARGDLAFTEWLPRG